MSLLAAEPAEPAEPVDPNEKDTPTSNTKKFKARIEIKNTENSLYNRLLKWGVIKDNPVTPIGSLATTDEGLIKNTDDYGTTYYYCGTVEDNYVIFANMCWRIVRITGNGAVKLTLQNNDAASCVNLKENSASLKLNSDTTAQKYQNGLSNYATSVAMMYGFTSNALIGDIAYNDEIVPLSNSQNVKKLATQNPDAVSYSTVFENKNKNKFMQILEQWYTKKLTNYES